MACHHPALHGSPLPYSWLTQGQQGHSDMSDSRQITCLCSCFHCFIRIGVLCAYAANQNLSSQVKNVRRLVNSNMRDLHTFANDTPMVRQKVSIWNTMLHKELGWSIIDGSVTNFPWGYTCESVCILFLFSLLKLAFLVMLALCNPFTREKRIFSPFVHATPAKLLLKRLFSYGEISPTIILTLMGGIAEETNSNQILKWINEIV